MYTSCYTTSVCMLQCIANGPPGTPAATTPGTAKVPSANAVCSSGSTGTPAFSPINLRAAQTSTMVHAATCECEVLTRQLCTTTAQYSTALRNTHFRQTRVALNAARSCASAAATFDVAPAASH